MIFIKWNFFLGQLGKVLPMWYYYTAAGNQIKTDLQYSRELSKLLLYVVNL